MNGIDKITNKITADAQTEIQSILAKAQAEAQAITEKYQAQANEEKRKILAAGEEQAKEIQRRTKSVAALEARQQLLATKQKLITEAFDKALAGLLSLPPKEYAALLSRLAAEAASLGTEEVVLSTQDRKNYGQQVVATANQLLAGQARPGNLTLSAETRPFVGGLLLKSGDVEVNCTLDTIVRLSKDSLALDVAAALFA